MYYVQYLILLLREFSTSPTTISSVFIPAVSCSRKRKKVLSSLRNSFDKIPRKDLHKQVVSCSWNYTMQSAEEIVAKIAPFHSSLCAYIIRMIGKFGHFFGQDNYIAS